MEYLESVSGWPLVGLSAGPIIAEVLEFHHGLIDYVEMPFEQVRHHPASADLQEEIPLLLHCSSMSVAGFVPPGEETLDQIADLADRTRTPWIGEHLAFISAGALADEASGVPPTELTYTVCPQLSEETLDRVQTNLERLRKRFTTPIILENSPQYFAVPGSTMTMPEFIGETVRRCDVDLLLDITHFLIMTSNMGYDPAEAAAALPLDRVVEVHLSGMSLQSGRWWDDHSAPVPDAAFDFLATIADRISPSAVTFEYNWAQSIPGSILVKHVARARELFAA
jgi:uncharacterized protein (UPF0276 family)